MKTVRNLDDVIIEVFPLLAKKEKKIFDIEKEFLNLMNNADKNDIDEMYIAGIYYYFFPCNSNLAKNTETNFWFEKFKSNKEYTEYDFAIDILVILKEYIKNKDEEAFNKNSIIVANKFGTYKHMNLYLYLTKDIFKELIYHITSFLLRDLTYFSVVLSIDIKEDDDLSDISTINRIFTKQLSYDELKMIDTKNIINDMNALSKRVEELTVDINNKDKIIKKLNDDILKKEKIIKDLTNESIKKDEEIERLKKDMVNIKEKLDKMHMVDTLKYSMKYIYRMFYEKYGKEKNDSNMYNEIGQLKSILMLPEFKTKYKYLYDFIDYVTSGDLCELNKSICPPLDTRCFDDISKYLKNDLVQTDNIVSFIKNLPGIGNYINLEIKYFFSKETLEKKINESYNFSEIFDKVISI